jgi:hypothetical protein
MSCHVKCLSIHLLNSFAYPGSSFMLCADSLLHVLKQEDDHGPMIEEKEDDGGSSSEDEIISMCRNNLVQQQNLILQLVPILGMYSDNYFIKLPKRVTGDSGLDWVHEILARDTQCYNMFRVERPLFYKLHNTLVRRG